MSLGKRYFLECESRGVVFRIDQGWLWPTLQLGCTLVSPTSDTASDARRNARKLGWTRPAVRFPIGGSGDTATAKFDLCYRCSGTISKVLGDLPS